MHVHLMMRLEGPMMAWGDATFDTRRPTRDFPTRSALAGLFANALGWTYRQGDRTTALQDSMTYAVRQDRRGVVIRDYQTVDLGREPTGWTRWGLEKRGGASAKDTHILERFYLAEASFLVAVRLNGTAPVTLEVLRDALVTPARPLHLGRKSCPPAGPLFVEMVDAPTFEEALRHVPLASAPGEQPPQDVRCWFPDNAAPSGGRVREIWDRRDFRTDRFAGSRRITEVRLPLSAFQDEEVG